MSWQLFMLGLVAIVGIASALLYARRRLWLSASAVLCAALSLILLLGNFPLIRSTEKVVVLSDEVSSRSSSMSLRQIEEMQTASKIIIHGDGLRAAQWHDLPRRTLEWIPPSTASLQLDFPRQLPLGRMFVVKAKLPPEVRNWRLQLLAENGELLAESDKSERGLGRQVGWQPAVAETLVLRARILDEGGKVLDQGPIPVVVQEHKELQVLGRFGAPSFDTQALNNLLVTSKANLDWQVNLGKNIIRSETAREVMTAPQVSIIDASYFENISAVTRNKLMTQVAAGMPLIILAGNLEQAALWSSSLDLHLLAAAASASKDNQFEVAKEMSLVSAPYLPDGKRLGAWSANTIERPWLWQRPWKTGRIVWVGVADWHRYAITSPQTLTLWWQSIVDFAQINNVESLVWSTQEAMPLVGERSVICVQGLSENEIRQEQQTLLLRRRSDQVDAKCGAIWPRKEGWQSFKAANGSYSFYAFSKTDWPLWQRALKREATQDYIKRLPASDNNHSHSPLTPWLFVLLFALSMLLIWWQDRR